MDLWSLLLEIYYSVFIFQLGESVRDYIVTAAARSLLYPHLWRRGRYLALSDGISAYRTGKVGIRQ